MIDVVEDDVACRNCHLKGISNMYISSKSIIFLNVKLLSAYCAVCQFDPMGHDGPTKLAKKGLCYHLNRGT